MSGGITAVDELSCDIDVLGVRPSTNGFSGPENLSQSSSGPSRNYEREPSQEPAVRLPPGPIPRANLPGQARQALPPQDISSLGSRFQNQPIPSSSGNIRTSEAYGGTTSSTMVSNGLRPATPSRDQFNRNGPIPGTPSSRFRGLPSGTSHPETPELPPPFRPQGLGYPEKSQNSGISYHSSRKQAPPVQDDPSISGLPSTNGASGLLIPTFNRTSTARDDGKLSRPAPLTLQTPIRSGFDSSPTTPTRPGIPISSIPGFSGRSTTDELDTGVNGTTRPSDSDAIPPKSSGPTPSPASQRAPQLPEPTKPFHPPQNLQLQPPSRSLTPLPRASPISPNGPPPSAFRLDELGPLLPTLDSALPSGALRSAPPSALVTSLPLRPADNPHSRNARISFFDPPNQTLLDRLLATDSAIVASSGAGAGGDNEEESVRATLTSVEEMLDGFEWATEDIFGKNGRGGLGLGVGFGGTGSAEQIEARLLDELMALEKVLSVVEIRPMSLISCFHRRTSTRSSSRTIG